MKRYWKAITAALLTIVMILVGLDIRFGTISGPCRQLPVLMYHHFARESTTGTVVSEAKFREQIAALRQNDFTAVTLRQLLDFADGGADLPEKPVLITMDDGYTSNLEIAAPILEEFGMCATVFVIGINEGEDFYVHNHQPLTPPRFSYEEAAPWVEKGVLDLQSHTFDLHQLKSYGCTGRDGVLPLEGESMEDYRQLLLDDCRAFVQRRAGRASTQLCALAYPFGYLCQEADDVFQEAGFSITFTTHEICNRLRRGHPETLRRLGRFNVAEWTDGDELVRELERYVG